MLVFVGPPPGAVRAASMQHANSKRKFSSLDLDGTAGANVSQPLCWATYGTTVLRAIFKQSLRTERGANSVLCTKDVPRANRLPRNDWIRSSLLLGSTGMSRNAISVGKFATPISRGLSFPVLSGILELDSPKLATRGCTMSRCIVLRLALPALLTAVLLPVSAYSQSQDSQSVAEAARRAKEQKKAPAKPAKVFTEDDVKPASPAASAAAPSPASAPGAAPSSTAGAPAANPAAESPAEASKEGEKPKEPKEVTALRDEIKQAESDLDWLQRELRLDQDALYSKTDYANDKAGIAKVDGEKQQVSDKQQEVDSLKAKLADLLQSLGITDSTPPSPKP